MNSISPLNIFYSLNIGLAALFFGGGGEERRKKNKSKAYTCELGAENNLLLRRLSEEKKKDKNRKHRIKHLLQAIKAKLIQPDQRPGGRRGDFYLVTWSRIEKVKMSFSSKKGLFILEGFGLATDSASCLLLTSSMLAPVTQPGVFCKTH